MPKDQAKEKPLTGLAAILTNENKEEDAR